MAHDFSPALESATAALGQSASSLAGASAGLQAVPSAPSSIVSGAAGARLVNSALSGSGSGALNVLVSRVRTAATYSPSGARSSATRVSGRTGTRAGAHRGGSTHAPGGGFAFPFIPGPSQIEQFVNVVPESLWIALATALALAAIGGTAAVRFGRRAQRQAGEYAAVAAAALTDPLTGVLNRRGFIEAVERELARASRYQTPFVLAYVDIRGLKAVNDTQGHLAGDEVIKQVAGLLGESVRTEDAVGRLGGDELALLLTGQSAHGAEAVVERIQARVPDCRDASGLETPWDLTIGTAGYPADGASFEALVSTADRRLYEQRGIQLR